MGKKKKQQEADEQTGRCRECRHAYLMRSSPENPVVCECTLTGRRWVASERPACGRWERMTTQEVINPMKFLGNHGDKKGKCM